MRVIMVLVSALWQAVFSFHQQTCPPSERPPGGLVVPPGSELLLGCSGWAKVDGLEVTVLRAEQMDSLRTTADRGAHRHTAVMETASDSVRTASIASTKEAAVTETQEAAVTETQEPAVTETQEAAVTETQGPAVTETKEAAVTETQGPAVTETQEAAVTETQEPAVTETQGPAVTETQEAAVTETQEPAVTETQGPAVTETQEAAVTETQEAAVTETQEPAVTETQEAAVTETQEPAADQAADQSYGAPNSSVSHLGSTHSTTDNIPPSEGALWASRPAREGGGVEEEEEGVRVARGLVGRLGEEGGRPQWRLNGRLLRGGEWGRGGEGRVSLGMRGAFLSLSAVTVQDAGSYSCHHRNHTVSFRVVVAVPPELPSLSCYKRSPGSKIRCDWTAQQPVTAQPQCHLFVSKSLSSSFSQVKCSYSAVLRRCWCAVTQEEDELRVLHHAYLCVSNPAGSAVSPHIHFFPLDILKPDPPSGLQVFPVRGHSTRLRVTWTYPLSWKERDRYFMLQYRLSYRPQALTHGTEQITAAHSYMITDAVPGLQYLIQLSAKEEFDGSWSDWSSPVYGHTWSATVPTAASGAAPTKCDYFILCGEGSGMTDEELPRELESSDVEQEVFPRSLWVVGCCAVLSVTLLITYLLRHKDRLVSKFVSLSNRKSCLPGTAPSAPALQEAHALMNYDAPHLKQPLPQEVEVKEGSEEEKKEGEEGGGEREDFDFNNISYFLVQRDCC